MATNLENKISDIIGSVIVALKAKGIDNLSVHQVVNYINDKYNVVLDDDIVKNVLSSTPGVSEINDDKIFIGKAPDNEEEVTNAVEQGKKTFTDQTGGMGMGGGAPIGGDAGMPEGDMDMGSEESGDIESDSMDSDKSSSTETVSNDETADDMDASLSDLDV